MGDVAGVPLSFPYRKVIRRSVSLETFKEFCRELLQIISSKLHLHKVLAGSL